ncbi:MAG: hypothetical protein EXS55_03320 [Candidatus Magasanikbacteria bacterium]|nr:hypothetical protein [Candidatus Magasanikbacteria bacterium]
MGQEGNRGGGSRQGEAGENNTIIKEELAAKPRVRLTENPNRGMKRSRVRGAGLEDAAVYRRGFKLGLGERYEKSTRKKSVTHKSAGSEGESGATDRQPNDIIYGLLRTNLGYDGTYKIRAIDVNKGKEFTVELKPRAGSGQFPKIFIGTIEEIKSKIIAYLKPNGKDNGGE